MEANKKKLEKVLISLEKALVFLPLLTSLAYLGVYFFETAYLATYDIPQQFVQIKTENFVFLLLGSTFISTSVFVGFDEYRTNMKRRGKKQKILFFGVYGLALGFVLLLALPPFIAAGLIISALTLIPLWFFAPGFFAKKPRSTEDYPLPQKLLLLVLPTLLLVALFSYMTGRLWAITQDNYAIVEMPQGKYAVVQSYGDTRLLVRAKEDDVRDFLVADSSDLSGRPLKMEKLEDLGGFDLSEWFKDAF